MAEASEGKRGRPVDVTSRARDLGLSRLRLLLQPWGEAAVLREQLVRSDSARQRLQRLVEIRWSLDLGQIAASAADAAIALADCDAAAVLVRQRDAETFVLSRELSAADERRVVSLLDLEELDHARPFVLPRLHDGAAGFGAGYTLPVEAPGSSGALVGLWREPRPDAPQLLDLLGD